VGVVALFSASVAGAQAQPPNGVNETGGSMVQNTFEEPTPSTWKISGDEPTVYPDFPGFAGKNFSSSLHSNLEQTDEVFAIAAPEFKYDWTAERDRWNVYASIWDGDGNVWYSPVWAPDGEMLVKLDGQTGERLAVYHNTQGISDVFAAPILLRDDTGRETIYTSGRSEAIAVDVASGDVLWQKPSGLAPVDPAADFHEAGIGAYYAFGPLYNPAIDAIMAVSGDGFILTWDRSTGAMLADPFPMPGAPTPVPESRGFPPGVDEVAETEFLPLVAGRPKGVGFAEMIQWLTGQGVELANHFPIDVATGTAFIAGTAPDESDGKADGLSDDGALYRVEATRTGDSVTYDIPCSREFQGGSASTPGLGNGKVYTADAVGQLIAIDQATCDLVWEFDLGSQVGGSPTVGQDNGEIYATTVDSSIHQVFDRGDHAVEGWTTRGTAFDTGASHFGANGIMTVSTATPNGVVSQFAGGGLTPNDAYLPTNVGLALLDRGTGEMKWFAQGGDESRAVVTVGPDGQYLSSSSPLNRVFSRAFFPDANTEPVFGGVTQFSPIRRDLLIRDAACAGRDRAQQAVNFASNAPVADQAVTETLIAAQEALRAGPKAIEDGDLSVADWAGFQASLDTASAALTDSGAAGADTAVASLGDVCTALGG
jgi:outer membrane protein assembly factor BamB